MPKTLAKKSPTKTKMKVKKPWPKCSSCSKPSVMFKRGKDGKEVHYCCDHFPKLRKTVVPPKRPQQPAKKQLVKSGKKRLKK